MKAADIITELHRKLDMPGGRHLYAILGTYNKLALFAKELSKTLIPSQNIHFPKPLNVNREIMDSIPDEEFRELCLEETKRPASTRRRVELAFEEFLTTVLKKQNLIVLEKLELILAYGVDPEPLRTLSTDDHRIIMLLPAKKTSDCILMFPECADLNYDYSLPGNLIANDRVWEFKE